MSGLSDIRLVPCCAHPPPHRALRPTALVYVGAGAGVWCAVLRLRAGDAFPAARSFRGGVTGNVDACVQPGSTQLVYPRVGLANTHHPAAGRAYISVLSRLTFLDAHAMKMLLISLSMVGMLPAYAEPLIAPSTLHGGIRASDNTTMPTAPVQPGGISPQQQTPRTMPAAAPATQNPPQTNPVTRSGYPALSTPRVSGKKSRTSTPLTAIEEHIQAQDPKQFAPPEVGRLNRGLASRFGELGLDEKDRAELKIDTAAFRQLRGELADTQVMRHAMPREEHRVMGLPGSGTDATGITAKSLGYAKLAMNPDHWCATYQQNRPRLSRLLLDTEYLTPGMAFVLKGVCLGDKPGSVEVRFPGSDGKTVQARILDWTTNKIFVELPDITGVPPATAEITAITADRRLTPARAYPFMPRWQLVDVPFQYSRVTTCAHDNAPPHVRSRCVSGKSDVSTFGYGTPSSFLKNPMFTPPANALWVHRYTEDDIGRSGWVSGEDHWVFELPPYAHLHNWQMRYERLSDSRYTQVRTLWDESKQRIVAYWRMGDSGDEGFLRYRIYNAKAWIPAGMRLD